MSARKAPPKTRPRKKPGSISTDSALFTATCFKLILDFAENEEAKAALLAPLVNSKKGTTVLAPMNIAGLMEKAMSPACESAADFLSRVIFGERLFKRLNFDDPKYVVAFLYCLLRLAPDSVTSQKPFESIKAHFGKYWRWPLVWLFARQFEIVRRRADDEVARGDLFSLKWRDECQKYANNLWIEERKKSGQIAKRKKAMINSFRAHPVIKRFINQSQSSSHSKT
jgi:hypothetical protein